MSERKEVKISEEEILRQQIFINEMRQKNEELYKEINKKKLFFAQTFGCAMN